MSTNQNDASKKLTGNQAAKNAPNPRESMASTQNWGFDDDYDSEEGDEEFGLDSTPSASNSAASKKQPAKKQDQKDSVSSIKSVYLPTLLFYAGK